SVRAEQSFALKLMPSPIKDMIAPSIYSFFGEGQYTSGLSNLGVIQLPEEMEEYIKRIECYPPPSIGNIVKAMVTSYQDHMYISFGNLSKNRMLERVFFGKIRELGIEVTIETNDEVNDDGLLSEVRD